MMITTTATTVATTTAVTTEQMVGMGVVAVVALIALLITKELAGASENARAQRLYRTINVAAIPLLLTFGAITVSKVLAVLS